MEFFKPLPVRAIKQGEYVRKIKAGNMQAKTYIRGAYDAQSKRYSLTDCNDINREIFVSPTTVLATGFTY